MATSTRYIGYCPCCTRVIKVRDEKLVHHGYERPGCGYIVGDCYGVNRTPHELSDGLAREFQAKLAGYLQNKEVALAELPNRTKFVVRGKYLGNMAWEKKVLIKGECPEYEWDTAYRNAEYELKCEIRSLKSEVDRLQKLIDTWVLKPLTTVEEEIASKREAKAARDAAKAMKKTEKINATVAGYQKRIDVAVRNHTTSTIADIYQSAPRKLRDLVGWGAINNQQALVMLERDHVWKAFGLMNADGSLPERGDWQDPNSVTRKLSNMGHIEKKDQVWPEGL